MRINFYSASRPSLARFCALGLLTLAGSPLAMADNGVARPRMLAALAAKPAHECAATQASLDPSHPMSQAIDALAFQTPTPELTRAYLLNALVYSPTCYRPDLSAEEYATIMEATQFLPAALGWFPGVERPQFNVAGNVWTGNLTQTNQYLAARTRLTYSFPADGTTWGTTVSGFQTRPNVLAQRLRDTYGTNNLDQGREYIRTGFAAWRRWTGLSYDEVADDNAAFNLDVPRVSTRGDIRVGGSSLVLSSNGQTSPGTLAYNMFPNDFGFSGSDMTINTDNFGVGAYFTQGPDSWNLRQVAAHEHGHGLGYFHTVPCNNTKLMEPSISNTPNTTPFGLRIDEIRGGQRAYGDRFTPNQTVNTAFDFGNLQSPIRRSVVAPNLSTNGNITANPGTGQDWFRFTLSSAEPSVTIRANPTGGTYTAGTQSNGCSGSSTSVVATTAGNLSMWLTNANGTTLLFRADSVANGQAAGNGETFTLSNLAAGTYAIRVFDEGPNPTSGQTVQLYDLLIGLGGSTLPARAPAPPQAIAGVNKRVQGGSFGFFNGAANSYVNDTVQAANTSLANTITTFAWDLDGNGTFEVPNTASPSIFYSSNGLYVVSLRVTDSNAMTSTDSINVLVSGAPTAVSSVSPNNGQAGTTIPITISGGNLKFVTSASQVTISGTGVTVVGTPTPNALGNSVTGLSLQVAANATLGLRNIVITNTDGPPGQPWGGGSTATRNNAFNITAPPVVACNPADIADNASVPGPDGQVDNGDFSLFVQQFFSSTIQAGCNGSTIPCAAADIADNASNPSPDGTLDNGDFSLFISSFFSANCP
jgi:hypothetical protein